MSTEPELIAPIVFFEPGGWGVRRASAKALELMGVADADEFVEVMKSAMMPEAQLLLMTRMATSGGTLRFQLPFSGKDSLDVWAQGTKDGWSLTLMPRGVELVAYAAPRMGAKAEVLLSAFPMPACTISGMGHLYSENAAWSKVPLCQRNPSRPVQCTEECLALSGCGLTHGEPVPENRRFIRPIAPAMGYVDIPLGRCGEWRVFDGRAVGHPVVTVFERNSDFEQRGGLSRLSGQALLAESLQSLREEERQAVARELHDGLGQELAVLNMMSFGLKQSLRHEREPGRLNQVVLDFLSQFDRQAQRIAESSRSVALGLRSETLVQKGLIASCTELIERSSLQEGLVCSFQVLPLWEEPEIGLSLNLYRCLQEMLSNIQRHSQATKAKVILGGYEGAYTLEVRDNGIGFGGLQGRELDAKHIGLRSMRERATMFGGELTIKTRPEVEGSLVKVFFRERRKTKRESGEMSLGFFDRLALGKAQQEAARNKENEANDEELHNRGRLSILAGGGLCDSGRA